MNGHEFCILAVKVTLIGRTPNSHHLDTIKQGTCRALICQLTICSNRSIVDRRNGLAALVGGQCLDTTAGISLAIAG